MKRHLLAIMLSIIAVFGASFGSVACDGDGSDQRVEVGDLSTEEGLIEFHKNGEKYPDNFIFEELTGYGRVINSTASREEALAAAEAHFTADLCTVVENELKVETDLFYGLYVKQAYLGRDEPYYYEENVVSFKKSVYDAKEMQFFTKDKNKIKAILDYVIYSHSYNTRGAKVYGTEIVPDGNQYVYTAYVLHVTYGDWDMQDQLQLLKAEFQINRATGTTTHSVEVVANAFVDGLLTNSGGAA